MAQIAISGRLGNDPKQHTTKNDKPMASAFMFGEVESRGEEEMSLPLNVIAFGRMADVLARHSKGQFLTVSGRLQGQTYNGEVRYSIVADSIVSAKAVQPGGRRKPKTQQAMDSYEQLYNQDSAA